MYVKAALNGKTNIPLAGQLKTTRPLMRPPPMPPASSPSTHTQAPVQRPSAHHTAIEEDLEEINIDEIHDTIDNMMAANNVETDNSNNSTVKSYLSSNIRCSNSTITTASSNTDLQSSKILIDSGATHNMINNSKLVHEMKPWNSHVKDVTLADGITKTPIEGFGTIHGTTTDGTTIKYLVLGHRNLTTTIEDTPPTDTLPSTNDKSSIPIPPLQAHDNLPSSLSKQANFTVDYLRQSFGVQNIDTILPHIRSTPAPNFHITFTDPNPVIDIGQVSTIDKSKKNTEPLGLPPNFGDVIHLDILYGAGVAHGGIKYALYLVDRSTRYKCIYPLKHLGEDVLTKIQQFCSAYNIKPKRMISDCEKRIFSKKVITWLSQQHTKMFAAPESKQRQNGLCERTWRTVLRIVRGWISSALLPPPLWLLAFKRAVEVSNCVPLKLNKIHDHPTRITIQKETRPAQPSPYVRC